MGEMVTGSVGKAADAVDTDQPGGNASEMPDAAEATEDQAVAVDGPTEETSADTDQEGVE